MEQPLPNRDPVGRVQSFPERDKQTQILSKNKICFLIMLCPKHPLLAIYCCPLSGKSCQSRWLRLWRRVPRKTAFPWWKPETVPDALCTFFTSGSLNQNLICNAFWFFFCSQRKPDFRLGSKTGSIHVLKMLTTITILSQIKGHLIFSLSSIRSRTRKFSLRPANFLLHTILFANSAHSILEQIQIGLDLRLLRRIFFFPLEYSNSAKNHFFTCPEAGNAVQNRV